MKILLLTNLFSRIDKNPLASEEVTMRRAMMTAIKMTGSSEETLVRLEEARSTTRVK